MSLSDVTGVFSRYFIVGFFVPSFFSLSVLKLALSGGFVPDGVAPNTTSSFLVVGAAALFAGLILLGLREPILTALSGYPLTHLPESPWVAPLRGLARILRNRRLAAYKRLKEMTEAPAETTDAYRKRRFAEWRLDRRFPNSERKVLPTRFGNSIRAWEDHARSRWSLETIVLWPRVQTLLTDQESKVHADAETDVAFFVNSFLGSFAVAVVVLVDVAVARTAWTRHAVVALLACGCGYLCYRAAVGAAERWGAFVRSSIDLHRRDVYEGLGLRIPASRSEDELTGKAINRLLLYAEPLPDETRVRWETGSSGASTASQRHQSSGSPPPPPPLSEPSSSSPSPPFPSSSPSRGSSDALK